MAMVWQSFHRLQTSDRKYPTNVTTKIASNNIEIEILRPKLAAESSSKLVIAYLMP